MDNEHTFTTPLGMLAARSAPLLGLTILWHTELERVGQQHLGPVGVGAITLNRFAPLFASLGRDGAGLGHRGVSRAPLTIRRDAADGVTISPADSRMVLTVNGEPLESARHFSSRQVAGGVVLGLGGVILICVHWMNGLPRHNPLPGLLGVSIAAIQLREQLRMAAMTMLPVLLIGETGTGKEVAARAIHATGSRRQRPWVAVNMATLSESLAAADLFGAVKGAYTGAQQARSGFFAEADGGTLFLDEVGDTPAAVQPMLLRVLENGEYRPLGANRNLQADVRLIAATDQDLMARQFNPALLNRMEGMLIRLPPLRERREDIGLLLCHMLREQGDMAGASTPPFDLIEALCLHDWPGNIRQLSQVLKRALIAAHAGEWPPMGVLLPRVAAPAAIVMSPRPQRVKLHELTSQQVTQAMEQHDWKIKPAAEQLGISRPSLYKLLEAYPECRRAPDIA